MTEIPAGYSLFRQDLTQIEAQLAVVWPTLRDAHVFITGGTGFFGIWILESLLWANEQQGLGIKVSVLSRSPERFLKDRAPHLRDRPELRFVVGSLDTFAFPDEAVTHIIHAASETNLEQTDDWAQRHFDGAIDGTRHVIELAAAHHVQSLLVTTSGALYAQADAIIDHRCVEGPSRLSDFTSERSVYGQSKRMMEIMVAIAAEKHGFKAAIARCFAFVGPYLPLESNYAIGNFMRDALDEKPVIVGGDGTPLRSYLYAADLVVWLLTILTQGESGVPYNVGGSEVVSISELARTVAEVADRPMDTVIIKGIPQPGAVPSAYLPSLDRTKTALGLNDTVNLRDAVSRTLAWHRIRRSGA